MQTQTPERILDRLTAMIGEVIVNVPSDIRMESRLREDLGFDSVAQMELISVVDEELGLDVDLEEVMHMSTIGDVVAVIQRYLARSEEA